MNIIVCVKQVSDTLEVSVDKETNTLIREGVDSVINPFDLYAVEEGLRLKNSFVLQNMKSSRDFIDILRTHKELLNDYPHIMKDVITSYFKVSDAQKNTLKRDIIRMVRSRMSFVKAARTFAAMLKGGI